MFEILKLNLHLNRTRRKEKNKTGWRKEHSGSAKKATSKAYSSKSTKSMLNTCVWLKVTMPQRTMFYASRFNWRISKRSLTCGTTRNCSFWKSEIAQIWIIRKLHYALCRHPMCCRKRICSLVRLRVWFYFDLFVVSPYPGGWWLWDFFDVS